MTSHNDQRRNRLPRGHPNAKVGGCAFKRVERTGALLFLMAMTMIKNLATAASLLSNNQQNDDLRSIDSISFNGTAIIDDLPCTIQRISDVWFYETFGANGLPPLYPKPIIVHYIGGRNQKFLNKSSPERLLEFFGPEFKVKLTSSNALSERSREVSLSQYLQETMLEGETPVARNANESWYLFGNTHSQRWNELLKSYDTPDICSVCDRPELLAQSFGIGNRGSGVQWHVHGPGVAETLHGRKHWMLYPYVVDLVDTTTVFSHCNT